MIGAGKNSNLVPAGGAGSKQITAATNEPRINILGGGPAGLYAAILLKRARPGAQITLFEQNPANATFGFAVVFSDQALDFLRAEDGATADLIEPRMTRWSDIIVNHRGTRIVIDGIGFAAIGRLELLQLLHSILYPPCRQARYRAAARPGAAIYRVTSSARR